MADICLAIFSRDFRGRARVDAHAAMTKLRLSAGRGPHLNGLLVLFGGARYMLTEQARPNERIVMAGGGRFIASMTLAGRPLIRGRAPSAPCEEQVNHRREEADYEDHRGVPSAARHTSSQRASQWVI